ncbi:hypothetical protein JIN77_12490 [Verrucomicrobiaceae bacterium R5-34]|nr:hypothetical protein [Verrucomicrobiaceae bacterium R5-34]
MKSLLVILIGIFAFVVLCIPDPFEAIPLLGALDEATATAILIACARYFGFDLSKFLGRKDADKKEDVIDVE